MRSQQKREKAKPQLRWLQPHPLGESSDGSSEGRQSATPSTWSLPSTKPRTVGQMSACEECRKRKKKCDRIRPACTNCVDRHVSCEYPTTQPVQPPAVQLRRLATAVRDSGPLTDLFSTLPYHEALELFNLLRETPRSDMLALVAQASDSDTPATATSTSNTPSPLPPELSVLGSLLPPASRPTEVELMVKHPVAYPVLLPIRASLLPLDDLLIPHSLRTTYITKPLDALLLWTDQGYDDQKHGGSLTSWHGSVPLLKPDWIARLEEVSVSSWTAIPIPDRAAVHAIALYLANDYPVMPLFDADLFLRDLVLNQPYFCSPFLVSALLGWACVSLQVGLQTATVS
jgi:hypothetical protein